MKKVILTVLICLLACSIFAAKKTFDAYPFAVLIFPAIAETEEEVNGNDLIDVASIVSAVLDKNISFSAMTFHKNNIFFRELVEQQILAPEDLENTNPKENGSRISESVGANGYCLVDLISFKNDKEKKEAELVMNVKIFKNNVETPIFDKNIVGTHTQFSGYWNKTTDEKAVSVCGKNALKNLEREIKKINGFDYIDIKKVEYDEPAEL